jgi:hypothetical protein
MRLRAAHKLQVNQGFSEFSVKKVTWHKLVLSHTVAIDKFDVGRRRLFVADSIPPLNISVNFGTL